MAGLDLRVPWDALAGPFGVDATVTPLGGEDIATTAIWVNTATQDDPIGDSFQRRTERKVLALSRDEVPTLPTGSIIVAPERKDDTPKRWRVEAPEDEDADQIKVLVIEQSNED